MHCPACGHQNLPGADACENCRLSLTHVGEQSYHDALEQSLMTDPVTILNPRPPVSIPADSTLGEAIHRMIEEGVGAVLVTDAAGQLVGILTERDFLAKVAGETRYAELPIQQFMTPHPEVVAPTDALSIALSKMDVGGYRHLPVVENGKPVGMISVRDILRHLTRLCGD